MRERWRRRLRDVWPLHVRCPRVFNGKPLLLSTSLLATWITSSPSLSWGPSRSRWATPIWPPLTGRSVLCRTIAQVYTQTHWRDIRERGEKRKKLATSRSYQPVSRSTGVLLWEPTGWIFTQTKWPSNNWTKIIWDDQLNRWGDSFENRSGANPVSQQVLKKLKAKRVGGRKTK
jgi:hypothetical protein